DATKASLELQGTAMALQLTQAALGNIQPTAQPPAAPPPAPQSGPSPAATADLEARIRSAKVLVYENTDERGIGMWIQDALDGLGMTYTQTGSYSGHFMEYLNSGVKYDLIIVGAEDKDKISGDFWDMISTRLTRDKAALIAEVWYLDREANGPINKILAPCGVSFRTDWPLAESIYWWQPEHPVFNEPNVVLPLLHYNRYWANQAGDKLNLGGSGDAVMLAGLSAKQSPGEGVLASCMDGRVIIQTFSDHDFRQGEVIPLWQNYIHYTLKNHFEALP
ncbi:MAG TPA: hypothetical protein VFH29_08885, partial [Anaerolineales bacterium]|nr:hypothetical protein [Anaerolineales bacterium]